LDAVVRAGPSWIELWHEVAQSTRIASASSDHHCIRTHDVESVREAVLLRHPSVRGDRATSIRRRTVGALRRLGLVQDPFDAQTSHHARHGANEIVA
jgi:hypothetical protein